MLAPGSIVGAYKVVRLIGKGGIAAVYKVQHRQLRSFHALKVLFTTDQDSAERLIREGRVQAVLSHPNIVAVTDVMEVDGAPALVMEYVSGPSLLDWLQSNKPPLDAVLDLYRGIVLGIDVAHAAGVVHRDLKPENILLAPTQQGIIPKVCDFGLVKVLAGDSATLAGVGFGTPEYMAPEQTEDAANVDSRADLWALGCLLYEMTTGHSAFEGSDVAAIYEAVRKGRYEPPRSHVADLPEHVIDTIHGLLQVDPDERTETASEVLENLFGLTPAAPMYTPSHGAQGLSLNRLSTPVVSVITEPPTAEWSTATVIGLCVAIAVITATFTVVLMQLVAPAAS